MVITFGYPVLILLPIHATIFYATGTGEAVEQYLSIPVSFYLVNSLKKFLTLTKSGLFFFIFILFSYMTIDNTVHNLTIKRGWCAWGSNLGQQDGKCRRIH